MRFIFFLICAAFITVPALAQTTYIPLWAKESWLLDRMEIKAGTHNDLNLSTVKPYMRKRYVEVADSVRQLLLEGKNPFGLSEVDQYNLDRFQANNSEFSRYNTENMSAWKGKKAFLGFLWPVKGNAVEVNEKDFYLVINPVVNQQQSIESDFDRRVFVNAKGITARGMIGNKIGFHFYATDNQEQGPIQFRNFLAVNGNTPGAGFHKDFKNGVGRDYFDARGSVTWNVSRFVNMQFGFDQHFIGNGYRSLFLGNFGPPHLFLKWNTRIWKLNYTNIFSETYLPDRPRGDVLFPKQYSATHHLSVNVLPWLNVGAFETVIFERAEILKPQHLQPIIGLNSLLRDKSGNSNSMLGLDVKANLLKKVQVYGQWLVQGGNNGETAGSGDAWSNRSAYQAGVKYVDVLGVKNLDVQAEINQVRPFMYSSPQNVGSWTNYRQPMAHPLGANFRELVGILRYQPFNKWYIFARVNYWQQGLDSANFNFGSNPRLSNRITGPNNGRRLRNDGYPMFAGIEGKTLNTAITVSYEVKENLFIDLNNLYRVSKRSNSPVIQNTNVMTIGIRWNMFRRDYDY